MESEFARRSLAGALGGQTMREHPFHVASGLAFLVALLGGCSTLKYGTRVYTKSLRYEVILGRSQARPGEHIAALHRLVNLSGGTVGGCIA